MAHKYPQEDWPDKIGNGGTLVSPGKKVRHFKIIDEIRRQQHDCPSKVIYLQQVQFKDERIEFRLCYYIIGKVGRTKGKWVFGQFATLVPAKDFQAIIDETKKRNWF
jgi:hypothetical protein